jgi:hypothetical protein
VVKHGVLFFILNTSYYEGGVTMSKWYRIRKAKKFADIIGGIANIIGNIYIGFLQTYMNLRQVKDQILIKTEPTGSFFSI